jgi:hypothetical protein
VTFPTNIRKYGVPDYFHFDKNSSKPEPRFTHFKKQQLAMKQ